MTSQEEEEQLKKEFIIRCNDCGKQGFTGESFLQYHKKEFPNHKTYILAHKDDIEEEDGQTIIC